MQRFLILLAIGGALAACTDFETDEARLSCAELADRRAAQQFAADTASLEHRRAGGAEESTLQRDLIRMDAESYRRKVYEDCLRLRGGTAPGEQPQDGG
jgi:uncharacterized membrane protein YccC